MYKKAEKWKLGWYQHVMRITEEEFPNKFCCTNHLEEEI
jgi:hypothetical protein